MKVNCRALKISIIVSSILFCMAIIFKVLDIKYSSDSMGFLKDLFLGCFCSSIITIFFYTSAYKVEKEKVLKQYWNRIKKIEIEIGKIEYMHIDYDEDMFCQFVYEQSNKGYKSMYYEILEQEISVERTKYTNLLKNEIKKESVFNKISKKAAETYVEEKVEKIYNSVIKNIEKISNEYLQFLDQNIDDLSFILDDIEFLRGKEKYEKAYGMYNKIYNLRIKIQEAALHFKEYKNGTGSASIVLRNILNLQKHLFRVEAKDNAQIIYAEFCDSMEKNLEDFRARVIYKMEPEEIKSIPVCEIIRNTDKEQI